MNGIDFKVVQDLGLTVFVTINILWFCIWLVKTIISIGSKHLEVSQLAMTNMIKAHDDKVMTILTHHEEERQKWMMSQEKYQEKIDRAMAYQREEHNKMMTILESIERNIATHR